jgi:protease I
MAKIAIVIGPGFDRPEFDHLYQELKANGHRLTLIGPTGHPRLEGVGVQASAAEVSPSYFDAVLVPGGAAPGKLLSDARLLELIKRAADGGCLMGAIGHGARLLVAADCVEGKTVTGDPEIKDEVLHSNARWFSGTDRLVEDGQIITAHGPEVTHEFVRAVLKRLPYPVPGGQRKP